MAKVWITRNVLLQDPKIINCGQNQMYLFSFFSEIAELQYSVQFTHSKLRQNIQSSVTTISQNTMSVLGWRSSSYIVPGTWKLYSGA